MISLSEYLELLKEYSMCINDELQDILKNAKTNFNYENITIKSVKIDKDNDVNIKLLIKENDNSNYIYEIVTSKNRGLDSLSYLESFSCMMIFNKFKMDNKTEKKIVELVLKYQDYFKCELNFENIMRKLRKIPNHLPFYNHECSNKEKEILDTIILEIDHLPNFIKETTNKNSK